MVMFALLPGLPEATGWIGTLWSIVSSVLVFFIYVIPLILIGALGVIGTLWVRFRKKFNVEVIIKVIANNNIVVTHDRGGVFKNVVGGNEFRLLRSKASIPVPDRSKFWMLNNKGKFTLELFKLGEEDYLPIQNQLTIKERLKGIIKPETVKYKESDKYQPVEAKRKIMEKFADIDYVPVPSPTKSHLLMKTRENIIKHQRQGKLEKYITFLPYLILVAAFIFLVIYYFKVAKELVASNQNAGKECLEESQKVLNSIARNCLNRPIVIPEEDIPPNPMEEQPP